MNKRVTVLLGEPDKYCSIVADFFDFDKGALYVYRNRVTPDNQAEIVGYFMEGTYKAVYCTEQNGREKQ